VGVQPSIEVQPSAMEINMSGPSSIEVRIHATIMDRATLLDKVFTFQILTDLCGYRQNITMISMVKGWRIGRT